MVPSKQRVASPPQRGTVTSGCPASGTPASCGSVGAASGCLECTASGAASGGAATSCAARTPASSVVSWPASSVTAGGPASSAITPSEVVKGAPPQPTYEELAAALEIKLERERTGQTAASEPRGAERTAPAKVESVVDDTVNDTVEGDNVVLPTEEQIEASAAPVPVAEVKAPAAEPVSPTAQKAKKVSMEDFEEAFKEVTGFNK